MPLAVMSPLRKRRVELCLTIDEVFLKSKINPSKLSRLERGILKPTEKDKKLLSRILEADERTLFPEAGGGEAAQS